MYSMNKKSDYRLSERGVVTVYMSLIIVIIMVASTLILTDVVARQFRSSSDVELTERAFYAASSGFEHAAYLISSAGDKELVFGSAGAGGFTRGKLRANMPYTDLRINFQNEIVHEYVGGKNVIHSICSTGYVQNRISRRLVLGDDC